MDAADRDRWRQWIQEQGQQLFLALNALSACRITEVRRANHMALEQATLRFDQGDIQRMGQLNTLLGVAEHLQALYAPIRNQFATVIEVRHE